MGWLKKAIKSIGKRAKSVFTNPLKTTLDVFTLGRGEELIDRGKQVLDDATGKTAAEQQAAALEREAERQAADAREQARAAGMAAEVDAERAQIASTVKDAGKLTDEVADVDLASEEGGATAKTKRTRFRSTGGSSTASVRT